MPNFHSKFLIRVSRARRGEGVRRPRCIACIFRRIPSSGLRKKVAQARKKTRLSTRCCTRIESIPSRSDSSSFPYPILLREAHTGNRGKFFMRLHDVFVFFADTISLHASSAKRREKGRERERRSAHATLRGGNSAGARNNG